MKGGWCVRLSARFKRDFKSLSIDLQKQTLACIQDLGTDPIPAVRRAHSISPSGRRPQVFSVDVTPNKAYKMSFELEGNIAIVRRVGPHKEIDRLA